MARKKKEYLKVSRPGEYLSFFTLQVNVQEKPAFIYLACDAFSAYAYNTGVEMDQSPESILKHIYLLTEHPDFVRHIDKGFTLVLRDYKELSERIEAILVKVNGKLLYNEKLNTLISKPLIEGFIEYL